MYDIRHASGVGTGGQLHVGSRVGQRVVWLANTGLAEEACERVYRLALELTAAASHARSWGSPAVSGKKFF